MIEQTSTGQQEEGEGERREICRSEGAEQAALRNCKTTTVSVLRALTKLPYRPGQALGLQDVQNIRICRQTVHEDGKVASRTHWPLLPQL